MKIRNTRHILAGTLIALVVAGMFASFGPHLSCCFCLVRNQMRPRKTGEDALRLVPTSARSWRRDREAKPLTSHARGRRRAASDWLVLVNGPSGRPCAVGFDVSSGLRADRIAAAIMGRAAIWSQCEDFRRRCQDSSLQCRATGLLFALVRRRGSPRRHGRGRTQGETADIPAAQLFRRLSISCQPKNARAVMRHLSPPPVVMRSASPSDWMEDPAGYWQ